MSPVPAWPLPHDGPACGKLRGPALWPAAQGPGLGWREQGRAGTLTPPAPCPGLHQHGRLEHHAAVTVLQTLPPGRPHQVQVCDCAVQGQGSGRCKPAALGVHSPSAPGVPDCGDGGDRGELEPGGRGAPRLRQAGGRDGEGPTESHSYGSWTSSGLMDAHPVVKITRQGGAQAQLK